MEMTLDSAPKDTPTDPSDIPLVGTATADEEDKESDDDEPVVDMDGYMEDDDPVSHMASHDPHVISLISRPWPQRQKTWLHLLKKWVFSELEPMT